MLKLPAIYFEKYFELFISCAKLFTIVLLFQSNSSFVEFLYLVAKNNWHTIYLWKKLEYEFIPDLWQNKLRNEKSDVNKIKYSMYRLLSYSFLTDRNFSNHALSRIEDEFPSQNNSIDCHNSQLFSVWWMNHLRHKRTKWFHIFVEKPKRRWENLISFIYLSCTLMK